MMKAQIDYKNIMPVIGLDLDSIRKELNLLVDNGKFLLSESHQKNKRSFLRLEELETGVVILESEFKDEICIGQSLLIHESALENCIKAFRQDNFKYSSGLQRWVREGATFTIRIQQNGDNMHTILCRRIFKQEPPKDLNS